MATPPLRPDDPDAVAAATFGTSFRGYDPDEVRRLLTAVASELGAAQRRVSELEAELEAETELPAPDLSSVDEAELMRLVGEETARVLEAARLAATERADRAEREAAEAMAAAEIDADRVRASAEEILGVRRAEAEAEAERVRADTLAEQMAAREEMAREQRDAEELAQSLIDEAEIVRERILAELARRRGEIRRQIEQLRAGRERLLAAYGVVRRTLEEASTELTLALPEARAAAENAGRGLPDEVVTVEQLERELEAARLVGLPILDPPAAVGDGIDDVDDADLATEGADDGVIEAFAVDDTELDEAGLAVEGADEGAIEAFAVDDAGLVDLREISAASRRVRVFGPQPPPEADALPREQIPTLVPSDELEEVRVLDDAGEVDEAHHDAHEVDEVAVAEEGDEVDADDGAEVDEVDEVAVAEEGDEVDADEVAEDDAAVDEVIDDAVEGGPGDDLDEEHGSALAEAGDDAAVSVDDLFARIRSSRAERVARAHEVLGVQPPVVDDDDREGRAAFDRLLADAGDPIPAPDDEEPDEAAGEPTPSELDEAAGEPTPSELDEAAGEPTPSELDEAAGEPTPSELDEAAGEPTPSELDEAAGEPTPSEPDEAAGEPARLEPEAADPGPDDERSATQRRTARDAAVESGRVALARLVKRALADDQSELLDAIRRGEARSGIEVLLPPPAEHRGTIAAAGLDLLSAAARAGAESAGHAEAAPALDALADRLGAQVVGPIRDRIERGVAEVGDDTDELLDVARAIYRDVRSQRLAGIVEAALAEAFQVGVFAATEAGSPIRWVVDDAGSCGPDCHDNALAGVVAAGEAFPTGHRHPPAHASCRCVTVSAG